MHYANKCNNYRIYTCTVYLTSTFNENSEISRFKHVIEIHKRREGCAYRNKAGKTEDPEGGGEGGGDAKDRKPGGRVCGKAYVPERRGLTPVARQMPSKWLSNTSLSSMTPPPLLVISIPAARPPNTRFFLSTG